MTIISILGHKSGQWMRSQLTLLVADDKPQVLGSMITYGRRYSVAGLAGISPDDDEDGALGAEAANAPQQNKSSWQSRQPASAEERQAGAIAAADKAARAPAPDTFRLSNATLQHRLLEILKKRNIDESLWEAIGKKMNGKEMLDRNLTAAVAEATNEAIPFGP